VISITDESKRNLISLAVTISSAGFRAISKVAA
jgi:hypothetical protein